MSRLKEFMVKHFYDFFSMRFYFTIFTVVEVVAALLIAWIVARLFEIDLNDSPFYLFAIISIVVAAGVAVLINSFFLKPIKRLIDSMKKVSEGDFSIHLKKHSKVKEIGILNRSFNTMVDELGETEVLQTDFVSNVSHEIKTPLNAIEGYATLLQDSDCTEEERCRYVDKILFNTKRLSDLVGNVLILSKLESGAFDINATVYRLDEQIRESIMLLESKWVEKEIEFDVELDAVKHNGDKKLLYHVWNNLLSNAIKFSPEGGLIAIRLYESDGDIVFTIDDCGPGISESVKKHLFDKFYQADSSHKQEGNGLGLALVKRIIDISEGEISAENLPDLGCRFKVILKNR